MEDPEEHAITYTYGTYQEHTGDATDETFQRTILVDARAHSWEFDFDLSGNLWRLVDPLGHTKRFRWDPQQKLIFRSEPFKYGSDNRGPGDNYKQRVPPLRVGPRRQPPVLRRRQWPHLRVHLR